MPTDSEQAVMAAAKAWWEHKRPVDWPLYLHFNNPTINAHATERDARLARAVAAWQQAEQKPVHPLACQNPACGHSRIAHGRYDHCTECTCRHFEGSPPEPVTEQRHTDCQCERCRRNRQSFDWIKAKQAHPRPSMVKTTRATTLRCSCGAFMRQLTIDAQFPECATSKCARCGSTRVAEAWEVEQAHQPPPQKGGE